MALRALVSLGQKGGAVVSITLLSTEELAVHLGVSKDSIRRLVRSGELPCIRLGERMIRFREADVAAYLDAKEAHDEAIEFTE